MTIARGVVTRVDDSTQQQLVDVEIYADESKVSVEHWHPYGLTQVPVAGAEVLLAFPNGDRSHGIIVGTADRRVRPTDLSDGDVAVHRGPAEMVHFTDSGITVSTAGTLRLEAASIVLVSDDIRLGGDDADRPAAMEGSTDTAGDAETGNLSQAVRLK